MVLSTLNCLAETEPSTMPSWSVSICATKATQYTRSNADEHRNANLAHWETCISGIEWLGTLVKRRKCKPVRTDSYPNRNTGQACDLLPILAQPDADRLGIIVPYGRPLDGGWQCEIDLHDAIASCPASHVLTIDVVDLS
jgi:hypothetical protein